MVELVDFREVLEFFLAQFFYRSKETKVSGLRGNLRPAFFDGSLVVRPDGADQNLAPILEFVRLHSTLPLYSPLNLFSIADLCFTDYHLKE